MTAPKRNLDRDALAIAACVAIVLPLMLLRLHGQGVAP